MPADRCNLEVPALSAKTKLAVEFSAPVNWCVPIQRLSQLCPLNEGWFDDARRIGISRHRVQAFGRIILT